MNIKKFINKSNINFQVSLKGKKRAQLLLEINNKITDKERKSISNSLKKTLKGKIKLKKFKIKKDNNKTLFIIRVKIKKELSYKESYNLLYGKLQGVAFMILENFIENFS